jgi:2-iminobutanoate/2-iminopropanoate deaminase
MSATATKQIVSVAGAPQPHAGAPYSQLVRHGNTVYTSGQIGVDPDSSELVGDDIASQTEQVMENIRTLLHAVGSDLENILSATIYLADLADWPGMNEVYGRFVGDFPPVRAAVQVGLPPGILIEVAVVACA